MRTPVRRFQEGSFRSRPDTVAGEEPLEIRLGGAALTTTMRTPGHDVELVHGLLHAEGVITGPADVIAARYCAGTDAEGQNTYNVLDITLTQVAADARPIKARAFVTSSACGVCGTSSIEALRRVSRYPIDAGPELRPELITSLPDRLREGQAGFRATGGLHGAALVRPDGQLATIREDVGRHNAVDKVIGAAVMADRLPLADHALLTSSRASFELVQKAVMAGIGMLIAVSAPSSLAVQLATEAGLTLIGFTSLRGFNIYSGSHRVVGAMP